MREISGEVRDGSVFLRLSGRIDSGNSAEAEKEIFRITEEAPSGPVEIDAEELEYISSAGLRVLLRLRRKHPKIRICNVSSEIYEIFDMTGFTQMMQVDKAYRVVSVEGCEEIGRGANGTIYRIDMDNVVKVYNNADALEEIQHEREVARTALVLGIPTAISYDVVRVGESYGSVCELLNARSFSKSLATEPEKMDWCVKEYVELLKKIHGTEVPEGELPDIRETVISWGEFMQDYLPEEAGKKLLAMIKAVPEDHHMIHGDYHTKNVELSDSEVLLIDMDTLAVGHPVFELASMFNAYIGYSELDPSIILKFQGFDHETAKTFWEKTLALYLGTEDPEKIRSVEDKARIVGYTRMIRRSIRRGGLTNETGKAEIAHWTEELLELLARTDSLVFFPFELEAAADRAQLQAVTEFVDGHLEAAGCPARAQMQIGVAVEEIFVNIASYAYGEGSGRVRIRVEAFGDHAVITLTDSGVAYDPLAKEDPDLDAEVEDRARHFHGQEDDGRDPLRAEGRLQYPDHDQAILRGDPWRSRDESIFICILQSRTAPICRPGFFVVQKMQGFRCSPSRTTTPSAAAERSGPFFRKRRRRRRPFCPASNFPAETSGANTTSSATATTRKSRGSWRSWTKAMDCGWRRCAPGSISSGSASGSPFPGRICRNCCLTRIPASPISRT